jgi:hypothetical protein
MLMSNSLNKQPSDQPYGELAATQTSPVVVDDAWGDDTLVSEVLHKYDMWRQMRRPYEVQWYLNASALRGFPDVRFNAQSSTLEIKKEPPHRKRFRINYIKPKYVARVSKYTKIPPSPTVVPATTDREDIMNAKASQKALEYGTRAFGLRQRYMQVMQSLPITGKAFLWVRWDEKAIGRQRTAQGTEPLLGEVAIDFGSAFEFLPADPGIERLEDQPEIMRAKMVPVRDLEERYPELKGKIVPEGAENDLFFYQREIADLGTRSMGIGSRTMVATQPTHALRIELFTKPCGAYPKGRYVVIAGRQLVKSVDELPGGFRLVHKNAYPVIEFCDDAAPGQFWPDAFVERLISLQSEYNQYRSQLGEHLTLHFFPKLIEWAQMNLSPEAYNSEAGEKIKATWIPGMPALQFLQPENVVGDVWNVLQHIKKEFDDVTLIYPTALGGAGSTTSGYQASLLQEAADQVHGPAIQRNALALEELYIKMRHLMKEFYEIPRLISVAGKNNIPEVYEFSRDSIDENADVIIEPDSMLPMMKTARTDMLRQQFEAGIWGNPQDPKVQKKVQRMLSSGWADFEVDYNQRDHEQAQWENVKMVRGEPLQKPAAWEDHEVHWEMHTDLFKSPESLGWTPEQWTANVLHAIVHLNYINPQAAMMMAGEYGLQQQLMQLQMLQQLPIPQPPQVPMEQSLAPTEGSEAPLSSGPPQPELSGAGGPEQQQLTSEAPPPMMGMEQPPAA